MSFEGGFTPEQSRRKRQLNLGVSWKKFKVTSQALRDWGFSVSEQDANDYELLRNRHTAMKNVSHGVVAENMLLEGADMEGKTEERNPYHWFGDGVMAYPPHEIDDVLHGVDAILMFPDEEDDRIAYPLAVDVKTDRDDADAKMDSVFENIARRNYLQDVYWVDTASEPGIPALDEPEPIEGKVGALRLCLHIPKESAQIFEDESRVSDIADREMRRLGEYSRRQMACQLETMALLILGKLTMADVKRGEVKLAELMDQDMLREDVQSALGRGPGADRALTIIMKSLETVWKQQKDNGDSLDPMPEMMPLIIKSLGQLRRPPKVRSA